MFTPYYIISLILPHVIIGWYQFLGNEINKVRLQNFIYWQKYVNHYNIEVKFLIIVLKHYLKFLIVLLLKLCVSNIWYIYWIHVNAKCWWGSLEVYLSIVQNMFHKCVENEHTSNVMKITCFIKKSLTFTILQHH